MVPKITKGMLIGELIMNCPSAVEVLFAHGFHCIGCGLSAYETLEQGAAAHGFDEEEVGQIIREIEAAAKKEEETGLARKCEEPGKGEAAGNKGGIIGKKAASSPKTASPLKAASSPREKRGAGSKSG